MCGCVRVYVCVHVSVQSVFVFSVSHVCLNEGVCVSHERSS